jgi:redox-sensitive bicupin YhaK (pirin superfamily)
MDAGPGSTDHNTATADRRVETLVTGVPAMDGAGVRLTRIIGSPELNRIDPFLLFDVFESDRPDDYIAGFPPHPHRGFETVTYMLAGKMEHQDSAGHRGLIEPGGVQWMTAARGIIHSEMPRQQNGLLRGVQLWVNLPARLKLADPGYREFPAAAIPGDRRDGALAQVVAGTSSSGVAGPVQGVVTNPLFLDVQLDPHGAFQEPLPSEHRAILYVVDGQVEIAARDLVPARQLAVLGPGAQLQLRATGGQSRFLLVAAAPLGEPVARGGRGVLNTPAENLQAFADYRNGRLLDAATTEEK